MTIDSQQLIFWFIQALGGGFCFLLWTNFRDLKIAFEANARELAAYKLHCSESYVTQNELGKAIDNFSRGIDGMFKKLDRIEEKLDKKQDKI